MLLDICQNSAEVSWEIERLKDQPVNDHLSLSIAILRRTFPLQRFRTIVPQTLHVFHNEAKDSDSYKALRRGINEALRSSDKLFLPIHCPPTWVPEGSETPHPDGHWALLVLESSGQVRYYETLNEENGVCLQRAREITAAAGLNPELVKRQNKFRQAGTDCGWWVLHSVEVEVILI